VPRSHANRDDRNAKSGPFCYPLRMPWTLKLPSPIALKDGRVLATLDDARTLTRTLPAARQRDEEWHYAMALIEEAATSGGPIRITVVQLARALKAEGLI
jgi:hypothetical protein